MGNRKRDGSGRFIKRPKVEGPKEEEQDYEDDFYREESPQSLEIEDEQEPPAQNENEGEDVTVLAEFIYHNQETQVEEERPASPLAGAPAPESPHLRAPTNTPHRQLQSPVPPPTPIARPSTPVAPLIYEFIGVQKFEGKRLFTVLTTEGKKEFVSYGILGPDGQQMADVFLQSLQSSPRAKRE